MTILVLGAAAGGGFPQWNCNCRNCRGFREGTLKAKARTQSSIAVSADSRNWVLVNTSPDILTQLKMRPQLHPSGKLRDTRIRAIVLVDSQLDHTIGLAMLREGEALQVYCTNSVREDLTTGNPVFRIPEVEGVEFAAVPVTSKAPPYSPNRNAPREDDNIALVITDLASGRRAFYAPGLAAVPPKVWDCMSSADCLLVDGTFWTDDEMIRIGAGRKRALDMGHLALSGENGMLSLM